MVAIASIILKAMKFSSLSKGRATDTSKAAADHYQQVKEGGASFPKRDWHTDAPVVRPPRSSPLARSSATLQHAWWDSLFNDSAMGRL
ncbi:MAG: hypothetical protein LBL06_05660 [Treponema sp.]|nr:hypothetical protein [Treponema sp.]